MGDMKLYKEITARPEGVGIFQEHPGIGGHGYS